eukprot:COSAG01_NODE_340_length_18638_cov_56.516505_11_plen_181_part_00
MQGGGRSQQPTPGNTLRRCVCGDGHCVPGLRPPPAGITLIPAAATQHARLTSVAACKFEQDKRRYSQDLVAAGAGRVQGPSTEKRRARANLHGGRRGAAADAYQLSSVTYTASHLRCYHLQRALPARPRPGKHAGTEQAIPIDVGADAGLPRASSASPRTPCSPRMSPRRRWRPHASPCG